MAMAAKENMFYVCALPQHPDSSTKLFYAVDASDPTNPTIIGSALDYGRYGYIANGLALNGSYAYVYTQLEGLVTLDISNPAAPQVVGTNDTLCAVPVAVIGNHLYASAFGYLSYLSLYDPRNPKLIVQTAFSSSFNGIAPLDEARCAICPDNNQVAMVDFSAPNAPKIVAYSSHVSSLRRIVVCAGSLFGTTGSESPAVIQFAWNGGDSIYIRGKTDLPEHGECLTDAGSRIVVGAENVSDLYLLATSESKSPYVIAEGPIPTLPFNIVAVRNRIYVNGGGQVYLVEVTEH